MQLKRRSLPLGGKNDDTTDGMKTWGVTVFILIRIWGNPWLGILTIETESMTDTIKNDFQSLNSYGTCL